MRTMTHTTASLLKRHLSLARMAVCPIALGTFVLMLFTMAGSNPPVVIAQSAVSEAAPSGDADMPVYTPPKKRFIPRARVGGSLRGTDGKDPEVVALVPDHVALTIEEKPVLNWFLSKPTTYPVRFTLVDTRSIKPLYEAPLPQPKEAGVHQIDLKTLGLSLEPDVQYRWYVSVVRNPDSPSQDIVAGGVIERCEFAECVAEIQPNLTCSPQSVITNARLGFWYDAMACLCRLINATPNDVKLRRQRAAMLKQVGLHGVADWDLRAIQASAH